MFMCLGCSPAARHREHVSRRAAVEKITVDGEEDLIMREEDVLGVVEARRKQ